MRCWAGVEGSMAKKALITGVTGQDGAYLARYLLAKGYEVHGVKRRSSSFNTGRIDDIYEEPQREGAVFRLHYGDLTDALSIVSLIKRIEPEEIYNLGAQSHVAVSFETPEYTANVDGLGTLRILEAVRLLGMEQQVRIYQASTSEIFGKVRETPQRETTPFYPRSPYGCAKAFAFWTTVNYREAYGLHASNGILFNHESPMRGETFVTRKVTRAVAAIERGLQDTLFVGNLNARRDWTHARDVIDAMWLMLQQDEPDDYVVGSGKMASVRDFIELAFACVDRSIDWRGEGVEEKGFDSRTGNVLVQVDPRYFRPTEVSELCADALKARERLGWTPTTTLNELVREMVEHDLKCSG